MAVTARKLVPSQQITAINATYYSATNVRTIIDKMTLTNTTSNPVRVTIYLVDYTGTAGASEAVISARGIGPGETYICPEVVGHILNSGDSIQGFATAGSAITLRVSGREIV